MKRMFITVVLLSFLGFTGWSIYQNISNRTVKNRGAHRKHAVAVETAPIRRENIQEVGSFTGTLSPRAQFIVAPKIGGRLERLLVDIGDHVQPGQVVAVLEDDEYEQQVEQARAELQVAKANLQECRSSLRTAKREFQRVEVLRQKKIASESELDSAESKFLSQEAKYKVALAQIAQKEAALKATEVRLSYTTIRITRGHSGTRVVGERFVDAGAMLAANDAIVSILDIRSLIAVVHVIERDYTKVKVGQKAYVTTDAFPEQVFPGKVIRIAPLIKEKSRQSRVEIEVPNDAEALKPGMFVRVQIKFSTRENATVIPIAALAKRDGRQGIFLVDSEQMKARFVPVVLGVVEGERAQVIDPDLSGSVVTLGQYLLSDGSSVILPADEDRRRSSTDTKDSREDARRKRGARQ